MKQDNYYVQKFFTLNKDVILVEGINGGLIQDLNSKKIFSIDKDSRVYLSKLINGKDVNLVLNEMSLQDKDKFQIYLKLLISKNLGSYSESYSNVNQYEKSIKTQVETLWLELRRSCNMNCCHCYLDSKGSTDTSLDILKLEEWKAVLKQFNKESLKRIILIGGEPLLFKEISKLIYFVREQFETIELVVYSNLTLINDQLIEIFKKNNVKVVTSLYSNKGYVHDKITGQVGSFEKTVKAIERLALANIYIKANMVVMNENYYDIDETKEFIFKITGNIPKIDLIRNVGQDKGYLLPPTKCISNKRVKANFKGISKSEYIKNISGNSCWQGKMNITCDGYVSPCIMGEAFINKNYNVREIPIDKIIEEYLIVDFWSVSKDKIEVCKECEYRYVCNDCRPICVDKNNFYAKDKNCNYNPKKMLFIE